MSYSAVTNYHRVGQFEYDAGVAVYDSSAVLGIGLGWGFHAHELWTFRIELSLGPLVLWTRVSHYRRERKP